MCQSIQGSPSYYIRPGIVPGYIIGYHIAIPNVRVSLVVYHGIVPSQTGYLIPCVRAPSCYVLPGIVLGCMVTVYWAQCKSIYRL